MKKSTLYRILFILFSFISIAPQVFAQLPVMAASTKTDASCPICQDGSIIINDSLLGGTPPYTYYWNDTGININERYNLMANTMYSVTVTDNAALTGIGSWFISFNMGGGSLNLGPSISTNPETCNSCNNGSIYILEGILTGTPPYTYLWSDIGPGTNTRDSLAPGFYWVTVTDSNMVTESAMIEIMAFNNSCNLVANFDTTITRYNDSVVVHFTNMSTGPGINSYFWDFGDYFTSPDENPTHVYRTTGLYIVSLNINDGLSCYADTSISILIYIPNDTSCTASLYTMSYDNTNIANPNGMIHINAAGSEPFNYYLYKTSPFILLDSIINSSLETFSFYNLPGETYLVKLRDFKGCTIIDTIIINNNLCQNFYSSIDSSTNPGPSLNNGKVFISPIGGTPPYTYLWNNGATTHYLLNIGWGNFEITITDANGCTVYNNVEMIEEGCNIYYYYPDSNQYKNPSPGKNDGYIHIDSIPGAPAPYTYTWSNGKTTNYIDNLIADIYYVTIIDGIGCHIRGSIELTPNATNCTTDAYFTYSTLQPWDDSVKISFTNGSDGYYNKLSWSNQWNYSEEENPVFTFYQDGFYDIYLNIWDSAGFCYDYFMQTIMIDIPNDTSVICNAKYSSSIVGAQVNFNNQSTGLGTTNIKYTWDFGDGIIDNKTNPSHIYGADGYYFVNLYLYDSVSGCSDMYGDMIYVDVPGDSTITCTATFNTLVIERSVNFTVPSIKSNTVYNWDFGDGTYSNLPSPNHVYDWSGFFFVNLTTYDSITGCVANAYKELDIKTASDTMTFVNADFTYYIDPVTNYLKVTDISKGNIAYRYWTFGDGYFADDVTSTSHAYAYPGIYEVCIYTNSSNGMYNSSKCKSIKIGAGTCNVKADFTLFVDNTTRTVKINNKSIGSANSYYWTFGDGNMSTAKNPSNTYVYPGYYYIGVSVYDSNNFMCTDYKYEYVKVGELDCKADFDFSVSASTKTVKYTNKSRGASQVFWIFDDWTYDYTNNPVKTYTTGGKHITYLWVTDTTGMCFDYKEKEVQVGEMECSAKFSYFVNTKTNTIQFSSATIGQNIFYYWIFGDGTTSTEKNPNHKFSMPGLYYVSLSTYSTSTGCMDNSWQTVTVGNINNDCEADFGFIADDNTKTVKFTNRSIGNNLTYNWHFGDTATSTQQNPTHTYNEGGYYNVCLTVKNNANISNITCKDVKVATTNNNNCFAQFNYIVDSASLKLTLTDKSTGGINNWKWYLGNNDSVTTQNPIYTYSTAGYYLIKLTGKNTNTGCISHNYAYVNVGKPDSLKGTLAYQKGPARKASGYPVDFVGIAHGDAAKLKWNFGDGTTVENTSTPTHYYTTPGTYTVCLTIEDQITGESSTSCKTIQVGNSSGQNNILMTTTAELIVYPNPIHSSATITYTIPTSGLVELSVINILGNKISSLVNETKEAGTYTITFNSHEFNKGIYLLQLKSGETIKTTKIIVE